MEGVGDWGVGVQDEKFLKNQLSVCVCVGKEIGPCI